MKYKQGTADTATIPANKLRERKVNAYEGGPSRQAIGGNGGHDNAKREEGAANVPCSH